ncbi:hypothetical protein D0Z08_21455 [Nocardioides immobilis]|uniref:Sigma-54 factor interaction domain-containing protein n=1 Tax=Nocardioides immobilis TaxID=2049295 RepID=A0A417XXL8_9ACTN|nr:hypothetical protein D0Z08_21455 [Nocardioides immobilis]
MSPQAYGPRDEILASWRRSYDDGAGADEISAPYDANLNLATKLVKAATPVIQRVQEDIMGSPITVILADSRGKILLRRSGERQLASALDRVQLAPGFNYSEKYVGTNGIGTALEGRTTSLVHGVEHFNEVLRTYACVGVPLRDPNTHRILGVLDITTWSELASPALTALVRQAGSVIEEGLLELSGRGAKALMEEYLHASRVRGSHVLAVSAEALLAAPTVTSLLGDMRRDDLWPLAQEALAAAERNDVPIVLSNGTQTSLQMRAVSREGQLVGAIIEVVPTERLQSTAAAAPRQAAPVAGFDGLSPATMGAAVLVSRHADERQPVCLIGEGGVGKQMTVRAVASQHFPARNLIVVDEAETPRSGSEIVTAVLEDLRRGSPVLVKRAEMLADGVLANLMSTVTRHEEPLPGWLAFSLRTTAAEGQDQATSALRAARVPFVAVPPLRTRVSDLEKIIPAMIRRHAGRRHVTATPALVSRLTRQTWPGNLTEVDGVIKQMVREARGDTLDEADLPPERGGGLRRHLTPIEWLTREAIVEALRANGGAKDKAAESLGISRASIYRKIKTLEIDVEAIVPG